MQVTGANDAGQTIQETVAIPSGAGGTVATLQDFKTVTKLLPLGGGFTAAVTVGTNGVGSTPWLSVNPHMSRFSLGLQATVTGTVNYTIEGTEDNLDPQTQFGITAGPAYGPLGALPPICSPISIPAMDAQTAAANAEYTQPLQAWRLTINSGSGSVTARGLQAGIRN